MICLMATGLIRISILIVASFSSSFVVVFLFNFIKTFSVRRKILSDNDLLYTSLGNNLVKAPLDN